MQITAEITQTYDLLKFAIARQTAQYFFLKTQYEVPFTNKSEATKKVERPKIKRQMYECHEPYESCLACQPH